MSKDKDRAFFGHPAGLSTLFFTEMWERFSYYGMRAFLILYLTAKTLEGGMSMSDGKAGLVVGLYTSSVYLLSLPGGWIADRFLGQRQAVTYGGVGIMLGNVLLAIPGGTLFYPGLALAAFGTGLLKPNVSTIVGQLYSDEDTRREAGFTIYYMGINIGAFGAPFVCGFLAQSDTFRHFLANHGINPQYSWNFAFGAVAIGMLAGLIQYLFGQPRLGDAGAKPTIPTDQARAARDRTVLGVLLGGLVAIGVLCAVFSSHLTQDFLGNVFPVILAVISISLFVGLYKSARDAGERKRIIAMIPLFLGAIAFFGIFEQASSTLNLFAERNTKPDFLGFMIPSYYQSVNSVFIILLAPVFAWLWIALGRKKKEPSSVNKFAIGMVFIALAIAVMLPTLASEKAGVIGGNGPDAAHFKEKVSGLYLFALYLFYTCSELCISPVGLASMSRLAPKRLAGMVMGTWFLAASIGNFIAGQAAGFSATRGHAFLYTTIIITSLIVAGALFGVAPMIRKMLGSGDGASGPSDKSEKAEPEPLPEARTVPQE
jgi:POT family proton-dependent oligopeptide transporter